MIQVIISVYRYILGYIVFLFGGTILIIATFLPPERLRYRAATLFCRSILRAIGVRLQLVGTYPTDPAYIFMPNHASFIDMFVMGAIMRDKFTAVMAEEQMKYPFWNTILNRFRVVLIRRGDRDAAIASMKVAEERIQHGYQVGVMPEGTRTTTGQLGPLKKGGFHMALHTGAPILPIGIEGSFRFKPKTSRLLHPGPVTVRIGKPIPAERYRQMTMEAVMEEVRQQLLVLTGEVPTG